MMNILTDFNEVINGFNQNLDELYASDMWKKHLYYGKYPNLPLSFYLSFSTMVLFLVFMYFVMKKHIK